VTEWEKLRICLYTATALPKKGGQELAVDALAREFVRLAHVVLVLAPYPRRGLKVDDSDFPYTVVRHPRYYSSRWFVSWYRWFLLRLHHRWNFDVLHCHGIYPSGYVAALSQPKLRVPLVITSHDWSLSEGRWRLAKPALLGRHQKALATADALIAISQVTAEGYRRLCPEPRSVVNIPNGVDLETLRKRESRPGGLDPAIKPGEYILFLGRLKQRKGVDLLLEAFDRLPGPSSTQLVVAGDGDERTALQAKVAGLQVQDRVRFVGWIDGKLKTYLLQNALCAVIPSRESEGFPLVTLECYGAGCPVIAPAIPGLKELVLDGQTGMLTKPESVESLTQALRELVSRPAYASKLGARGSQFAGDYSWNAVARRHLELYENMRIERKKQVDWETQIS